MKINDNKTVSNKEEFVVDLEKKAENLQRDINNLSMGQC